MMKIWRQDKDELDEEKDRKGKEYLMSTMIVKKMAYLGSFVLHVLVGFCWDKDRNRWDGSQLLKSQTPTIHPS